MAVMRMEDDKGDKGDSKDARFLPLIYLLMSPYVCCGDAGMIRAVMKMSCLLLLYMTFRI